MHAQDWNEIMRYKSSDLDRSDALGYSISISGNRAVVSSSNNIKNITRKQGKYNGF